MSRPQIPALAKLLAVASSISNPYLEAAKAAGRKIVGTIHDEVPEEVISAAGAIPVMLRGTGSEGTELSEIYFRQLTCGYTRHTYNQILDGAWDFLDGAVIFNICDHMRRVHDNWIRKPGNPVYHFVYAPKKQGELAKGFYRAEIDKFIAATEQRFGVQITDEALARAIALHNEKRVLQQQLYAMQKARSVPLTGSELLMVMLAGKSMPLEDYNALLRELIAALKANPAVFTPAVRVLYSGGHADNLDFFQTLETRGAQIVIDGTGFGYYSCEQLVRTDIDPREALVNYYFEEIPASPRKFGTAPERRERIGRLIREYGVDGVIMSRVTFCDLWAFEQYMTRDYLQQQGVPFLELEVDYVPESMAQVTTRVQAFVERIQAKKE